MEREQGNKYLQLQIYHKVISQDTARFRDIIYKYTHNLSRNHAGLIDPSGNSSQGNWHQLNPANTPATAKYNWPIQLTVVQGGTPGDRPTQQNKTRSE